MFNGRNEDKSVDETAITGIYSLGGNATCWRWLIWNWRARELVQP